MYALRNVDKVNAILKMLMIVPCFPKHFLRSNILI